MIMRKFTTCLIMIAVFLLSMIHLAAQNPGNIPRPNHPNPQFIRDKWLNLNGEWDFSIDFGESGKERGLHKDASEYDKTILVPFCPESKLSGIEYTDFMPVVWYHRSFKVPAQWERSMIFLHFGAVDYQCEIWVNDVRVGSHFGGSTSFSFDITDALKEGSNDVYVRAEDNIRSYNQPSGKQSMDYNYRATRYTRVTGIWQTVWLEARPESFIRTVRVVPDLDISSFLFTPDIENIEGTTLEISIYSKKGEMVAAGRTFSNGQTAILKVENPEVWGPGHPYLYDLKYTLLKGGKVIDKVDSYGALRKTHFEGNTFYLNNEPVFQRLVLIQGFYPGGVWTAPDDQMLKEDIERAQKIGFNGARLHEKIFENRLLYWADKLGFLVWGEFPDKGCHNTYRGLDGFHNLKREWIESMAQQWNHPCIIAWGPLNEAVNMSNPTWNSDPESYNRAVKELYDITKWLDPTRPINDASGWVHVKTDLFTVHNYDLNTETFSRDVGEEAFREYEKVYINPWRITDAYKDKGIITSYEGNTPYIVDEYGALDWLPDYSGNRRSAEEVVSLIGDLTAVLLNNPHMAGFCFTQLYDVMHEVNGVYTYEREPKFNTEELREIFGAPAAYTEIRK